MKKQKQNMHQIYLKIKKNYRYFPVHYILFVKICIVDFCKTGRNTTQANQMALSSRQFQVAVSSCPETKLFASAEGLGGYPILSLRSLPVVRQGAQNKRTPFHVLCIQPPSEFSENLRQEHDSCSRNVWTGRTQTSAARAENEIR